MKRPPPTQTQVTTPDPLADFDDEPGYYKDLYFPSDPTGDIERTVRLRFVFQEAGFVVRVVEQSQHHPTVWIICLGGQVPNIPDDNQFALYIRQLLLKIDIALRKNELSVQRSRNRIQISFVLSKPVRARRQSLGHHEPKGWQLLEP